MKIVFIQTGGTIDKDYPRKDRGYAFEIGKPAVERIMQKVHPDFDYKVISILKKDSLDITDNDRDKIHKACMEADSKRLLITHGTDTMIETARKLNAIKNKVIILTGAMKPEKFSDSDAAFNVGTAIGALNVLDKGIYIAMNGRIYHWNKVKRDKETGQFADISDST
jgi:L-asparaginase